MCVCDVGYKMMQLIFVHARIDSAQMRQPTKRPYAIYRIYRELFRIAHIVLGVVVSFSPARYP